MDLEFQEPKYFDRNGLPISRNEWLIFYANREYTQVALSSVRGSVVSTVWVGLDMSFGDVHPPLIFETSIFNGRNRAPSIRASSQEAALINHESAVILLQVLTLGEK